MSRVDLEVVCHFCRELIISHLSTESQTESISFSNLWRNRLKVHDEAVDEIIVKVASISIFACLLKCRNASTQSALNKCVSRKITFSH
jgi:hypothetical protein